jgi:diadenosine tetraphosphate (Ap4A) HIT family hydrolase
VTKFQLHPQLAADCHAIGRFDLCHVLLHKNASVPWFILVPETNATDLLDLPDVQRALAIKEAALVSEFLKTTLGFSKVNFASIGNVVPQLHLHVVGRKASDPCWPAPVWGNLRETREYSSTEVRQIIDALVRHSGLRATDP